MPSKLMKFIHTPGKLILSLGYRGWFRFLSDEAYLKLAFRCMMGYKLNLDDPQTFNEKLQWLKLYDRRPEYTMMADKYAVRQYIADTVGKEYLIPLLGVWDSVEDIDFDALPEQFVLKCTHDSGGLVICRDKSTLDVAAAKKKLRKRLKRNFYWAGREWPYKDVKPRVIAEKYMEDGTGGPLVDYKVMCFNGKARCAFTCTDRKSADGLKVTFFDLDWQRMPFERHYPADPRFIQKPSQWPLMLRVAEKISGNMEFARIDFYSIKDTIYLGEITHYPGCGFEEFSPVEWDYTLGSWLTLPEN